MANEIEYICETKIDKDWQKQLNQWKHMYNINIISMVHCLRDMYGTNSVCIILTRSKKEIE